MAVAEDKLNTLAIVTIGIASVLLLWASIVALQAYYESSFGEEMERKRAAGQDSELRTLRSDQRAKLQELRRNDDGTVRIRIDRAKQLVVSSLRTGEPSSLVPAVGPHDTPTVPAEWGRPPDDVRPPENEEGEEDAEDAEDAAEDTPADGETSGEDGEPEASGAPAPAEPEPRVRDVPSPEGSERAIDPSEDNAPAGAQEGDDADNRDEDAPGRDGR